MFMQCLCIYVHLYSIYKLTAVIEAPWSATVQLLDQQYQGQTVNIDNLYIHLILVGVVWSCVYLHLTLRTQLYFIKL